MTDISKVMAKVAALRELAARAGTQAEADAAAAQAEAIIARYQLDEAEIDAASGERAEAIGEEEMTSGRLDKWRSMLIGALSKDHGCYGYMSTVRTVTGSTHGSKIVGRASDIAIVRYMYAWLTVEIVRLSQREHGRAAQNAFRLGAALGVIEAMRAARKATVAEHCTSTGAAMVLASRYDEALAWLKAAQAPNVKWRSAGNATMRDRDAFVRGQAAGAAINTSKAALPGGNGGLMLTQGRR